MPVCRRVGVGGEVRSPSTVSTVAGSAGPVVGTTWKARVAVSALTPKGTHAAHAVDGHQVGRDARPARRAPRRRCAARALLGQRGHGDDRAVDAGAELVGDRRVGRVRARAGRLAAAVGQAELDLGDRDRDDAEQRDDGDDGEPRVAGDEADVPAAVLLLAVVVGDGAGRRRRPATREPGGPPAAPRTTTRVLISAAPPGSP